MSDYISQQLLYKECLLYIYNLYSHVVFSKQKHSALNVKGKKLSPVEVCHPRAKFAADLLEALEVERNTNDLPEVIYSKII